jgi:pyruvate dehydrogenase E2 component (dihydrolipoamide acetyltransferase)
VKASPLARRMANEMGVELESVSGSGPGGRVVKSDIESASTGDPKDAPAEPRRERREAGAKGEVEIHELTRLQQTVSRRMAESKATAPDFTLTVDVDMTLAVELRSRLKQVTEDAPSYNDMVVKAAATALREHPRVNAAYRDGKFELYSRVNVGIAVAAQDALVVPTIFDADRKSLGQIARDARVAAEKVRAGRITPPEVAGGTFTVSNLGMFGIDEFTAVINPPQAAILTVGALKKRPAVDDSGRVVARDQIRLSLISDQRILYGAEAAEFLARVRQLLEQPLALAL